jgi:hypothetical protein
MAILYQMLARYHFADDQPGAKVIGEISEGQVGYARHGREQRTIAQHVAADGYRRPAATTGLTH